VAVPLVESVVLVPLELVLPEPLVLAL